jgi:alkanesulfonate monooxygenase SsuD/methylene tetrahydromethanopterin reductase-like flavin-dependent oxidoreductase (luciferase family)
MTESTAATGGGTLGFGVSGTLDHAIARTLAAAAEEAGYAAFWVNDLPKGDGLAALAEAASVTRGILLGVGVIPLDRQPADRIGARVAELALPGERLLLGIGSGGVAGGLERVRQGAETLHGLTSARIAVGALGPKMCRLAGESADAVLLNWLTPEYIPESAALTLEGAEAAGRPRPLIAGYVRTALDEGLAQLQVEADRYASFPAYAANFIRMGADAMGTTVHGPGRAALRAGLARYEALLDHTVVRCVAAEENAAAYLRVLEAAAPGSP